MPGSCPSRPMRRVWPNSVRCMKAALPDATWFQKALARHGYPVEPSGRFDGPTMRVLMNFQMRYRPADYSGSADAETAALLHVLTQAAP
jgi:N-acetylmuramoyl-L-alanine amidase